MKSACLALVPKPMWMPLLLLPEFTNAGFAGADGRLWTYNGDNALLKPQIRACTRKYPPAFPCTRRATFVPLFAPLFPRPRACVHQQRWLATGI